MKHKQLLHSLSILLPILIIASLVNATTLPLTVDPDNLVLRDSNGNIAATSLTIALINNTDGYVQLARAIIESGTTFPTDPAVGYVYYRTDLQSLYIWTSLQWATCMTSTIPPGTISYNDLANLPDLTVYLLKDATRGLTADWNVTSHGIYDVTFLNATSIYVTDLHATNVYANTIYLGALLIDPVAPAEGQMWYNSAEDTLKYYNGTAIVIVPGIGGGGSSSYILPSTYNLYKSSSTYYMEKYDGTTWSSTNGSKVINYALGNLTSGRYYPEKVSIRGDWVVDSSIQMPAWSMLEGPARINFTSGLTNENMIEFRDSTYAIGIWVRDLVLYGNYGSNTGCRGIFFASNMGSSIVDPSKEQRIASIEGCKIQYFNLEGINCVDIYGSYDVGSYTIQDCFVHYNYRSVSGYYDINMTDTTDSCVIRNEFSTGFFRHMTASKIEDNYFGGGNSSTDAVYLYGCQGTLFANNIVDYGAYNDIYIYGAQTSHVTIQGNRISNPAQYAEDHYSAVNISSTVGTADISISLNQIYITSGHHVYQYGIYEASGADENSFCLNIISSYTQYGIGYYGNADVVEHNIGTTHDYTP